jgi:hypothetical protein
MVSIIYKVAEDMDFTMRDIGADFNAGYDFQPGESIGSGEGRGNPIHRVVVGDSNNG